MSILKYFIILSLLYFALRALHDLWCYPYYRRCLHGNCYYTVRGSKQNHVDQGMINHTALHDLDWGD